MKKRWWRISWLLLVLLSGLITTCSPVKPHFLEVSQETLNQTRRYLLSLGKRFSNSELPRLKQLNLSDTDVSDDGLRELGALIRLERLSLKRTHVTGSGLSSLLGSEKLTHLDLEKADLSNDALSGLSTLEGLRTLNLSGTVLNDQGAASLRSLTKLVDLDVSHTAVTDVGLAYIGELKKLEKLNLSGTGISDAGLSLLNLRRLEYLDLSHLPISGKGLSFLRVSTRIKAMLLSNSLITNRGISYLVNLPTLEFLVLSDTKITNQALDYLKHNRSISHLDLTNTRITGEGFSHFYQLPHLKYLSISGTHISYTDFMLLKMSLPQVEIVAHYMIASTHASSYRKIYEMRHNQREVAPPTGEVVIKEPVIVGMSVPFEIIFYQSRQGRNLSIGKDETLLFMLDGIYFTLFSGESERGGLGRLEIPLAKLDYSDGKVRGTISLERMVSGRFLKVYRRDKEKRRLVFVGETRIDRLFTDSVNVLFSKRFVSANAGEEVMLSLQLVNHRGKPVTGPLRQGIWLDCESDDYLTINGKKTNQGLQLTSRDFVNGVATLRVKAEKMGHYIISHTNKGHQNSQWKKGWNFSMVKVGIARQSTSLFRLPRGVIAGQAFQIEHRLMDVYGNRSVGRGFRLTVTPHPKGNLVFNGVWKNADSLFLNRSDDELSLTRAGRYTFILSGVDKTVRRVVTVIPDAIGCYVDNKLIARRNKTGEITIPIHFHDRFGNPPVVEERKRIVIFHSPEGKLRIGSRGLDISTSVKKETGKETAITLSIRVTKETRSGVISILPKFDTLVKVLIPDQERIVFKAEIPDSEELSRKNRGKPIVISVVNLGSPNLSIRKGFGGEKELTPALLSQKLSQFPRDEKVSGKWRTEESSRVIQHEYTYYRNWDRLDYQKWDLTNRKRLERILWRNLKETEIHAAATKGFNQLPGKMELFK